MIQPLQVGGKEILHSKRANIYYLEHCRVMVKGGRVVFLTPAETENQYWNIPIANTTVILLGTGTSLTQAAVRMLCGAGVMLGFSGGGGTPLLAATEVEWFSPQSEYRPTEYLQAWVCFWFDDHKRLAIARFLQEKRLGFLRQVWERDKLLRSYDFALDDFTLEQALQRSQQGIAESPNVTRLLQAEARLTRELYKFAANRTNQEGFTRSHDSEDLANQFLNHGNYLAYGLAATCLWVLGIPHGFAVMHGKTRRGALVFDVADLIKDAIVLPLAFIAAEQGAKEQEFRQMCLQGFTQHAALDFMFDVVKEAAQKGEALA
ncbi:MAG: type I-F CRISPR-associated endonuclease Cas1 [Thiothrix sp.]|nr:type I-F CRISPR-associated endonuclease Cas1 [Thiothrix sp.]HPQ95106.1 type I-F CRISPR-associated endonuclease Cas1f [Thiolinea sp.]